MITEFSIFLSALSKFQVSHSDQKSNGAIFLRTETGSLIALKEGQMIMWMAIFSST